MIQKSGIATSYYGGATNQLQNISKTKAESASTATKTEESTSVNKLSRAEEIKAQIAKGEYKIDINATAQRMAQDLLM